MPGGRDSECETNEWERNGVPSNWHGVRWERSLERRWRERMNKRSWKAESKGLGGHLGAGGERTEDCTEPAELGLSLLGRQLCHRPKSEKQRRGGSGETSQCILLLSTLSETRGTWRKGLWSADTQMGLAPKAGDLDSEANSPCTADSSHLGKRKRESKGRERRRDLGIHQLNFRQRRGRAGRQGWCQRCQGSQHSR